MRCRWFAVLVVSVLGPAAAGASPYVFVASPAADSVAVLDAATGDVVNTIPLDGVVSACAMGADGGRAFVARAQADSVAVVDRVTGVERVVAVGARPSALAFLDENRRLYVANAGDDTVSVVNPRAGTVVATIPVGDEPMAVAAGQGRVYVANWGGGTVSVIDAAAGAVVGTVTVGTFPSGLALAPAANRLYVANFLDATVSVVDTVALSVVATIPVGRGPRGLAVDEPAGRLYVAAFDADRIDVVDTATNAVVLQGPSGGVNPLAVEALPATRRLFVAHLQDGANVSILDADTLSPVGSVAAPIGPVALASARRPSPGLPLAARGRAGATVVRRGGSVTYSDTEFDPARWIAGGPGAHAESQMPTGGNPGAWRRMQHFPVPFANVVRHLFVQPGAEYDPAVEGAIGAIDVSWHRRILPSSASEGAGLARLDLGLSAGETFFVQQGGVDYHTVEDVFATLPWQLAARNNLTAADFDDGAGGEPDFSAAGSPLRFGYSRTTDPNTFVEHGIDNFTVTVRSGATAAGVLGFAVTTDVATDGQPVPISLRRSGGVQGAVSVTMLAVSPDGSSATHVVSWADGDDAPKDVSVAFALPNNSAVRTAHLFLIAPTGGAGLQTGRGHMLVAVAPSTWPPALQALIVVLGLLLASLSPGALAALVLPFALAGAARLVRRRRGAAARALGAAAACVLLPSCVPTESISGQANVPDAIWNDRIRPDGKPLVEDSSDCADADLVCLQKSTDPWVGHYETRDENVVSEIYPELGSDPVVRRLPKSDCLWVPEGQAMRASWEAVVGLEPGRGYGRAIVNGFPEMDAEADAPYGADFYPGGLRWFSACRLDTPYDRRAMIASQPGICEAFDDECEGCTVGPYWTAALADGFALSIGCDDPNDFDLGTILAGNRVHAFDTDLRAMRPPDPRPGWNLCAPARPGAPEWSAADWVASCPSEGGLLDACGDRCVFQPTQDATLAVASTFYGRARVLSPALMTVKKDAPRRLLRPMERRTSGGTAILSWFTPPSDVRNDPGGPQPEEPSLRWEENFTPDVRVAEVRIKDVRNGGEVQLAPTRLRVLDPVGAATVWDCPGALEGAGKVFRLTSSSACRQGDGPLGPLAVTPTYVVANATQTTRPPIVAPLTWEADLPAGVSVAEPVIEFRVVNVACTAGATCNALKAEEVDDLGGLQVGKPHRLTVEVTNVGPEPLRVGTVRMEAVAGYPDARGDFAIELLSDPRAAPAAVELTAGGELRLGADFATNPLVRSTTTPDGQPSLERTLDRDGARIAVAGDTLTATGDPSFEDARIVYEDPGTDFSWRPTEPGLRRPFAEVVYLRRATPFYVDPGHSFLVRLTVTPRALGHRRAYLSVGATADSNPAWGVWTRPLVKARGISGPSLVALPEVISFPRQRLDAGGQVVEVYELNALAANYGNVAMTRGNITFAGPDAGRFALASSHPPSAVIPPGGDEIYTVRYAPSCAPPLAPPRALGPRQYEAELRVTTNGGEAVFALRGEWCPQLSPP
jgi:YVTN family beta-propeller protein